MKKLFTAFAIAASLLAAGQAQAELSAYTIGGLNITKVKDIDFTEPGVNFRMGLQFNPYFAAEAGYDFFGRKRETSQGLTGEVDLQALTVAGVLRNEFTPGTYFRASGGVMRIRADGTVSSGGQSASATENRTRPFFGLGIESKINRQYSVIGEYRYVEVEGTSANNFNLGLKVNF